MGRFTLRQSSLFLSEKMSTFLFVFCLTGLVLCGYVGLNLFWTESEMWPAAAPRNFAISRWQEFLSVKPLFNFLMLCLYKIALAIEQVPFDVARIFMVFNLVAIIVLVICIVKKITKNELLAFVTATLLLLTITILEQGTRIRSDLIVCSLVLWTFYLILNRGEQDLKVWIPAALSLLVSPKAIYWIIALLPFFPNTKWILDRYGKRTIGLVLSVFIIAMILNYDSIAGVVRYYLLSFTSNGSGLSYFDPIRLVHLIGAIKKDYWFWLLVLLRLFWVRSFKKFDAVFIMLLIALILHPERMPFFIVSIMPFLLILIVVHPSFCAFFNWLQIRRRLVFAFGLVLLSTFLFYRNTMRSAFLLQQHSNKTQRQAIQLIQDYSLKEKAVTIYDPVGVIYKVPVYDWFVGPSEMHSNAIAMAELNKKKPDMILYTSRLGWLEPEIYKLLKQDYVNLGGGVYGRFPKIELQGHVRELMAEDIIFALPNGKIIDNPDQPIRIFVFDKHNEEVSKHGYWLLKNGKRISLANEIPFVLLQTEVNKAVLPNSVSAVRVSFWSTFQYTIPTPIYALFRFDADL